LATFRERLTPWILSNPDALHSDYVAAYPGDTDITPNRFYNVKNSITRPRTVAATGGGWGRGEGAGIEATARVRLTALPQQRTFERHVVLSDLHYRTYTQQVWDAEAGKYRGVQRTVHDPAALRVVEAFLRSWKPDVIWFNGDMLDAAPLSKHEKEPYESEGLEQDILGVRAIFRRFRRDHPRAEMHYLLGNHEAWLAKYLRRNAVELRWLSALSYQVMFDSAALRMPIYEYGERVPILPGVLEVTHGDKIAPKSGYTAHKMLEAGISGVSGHVHRLGMVYRTTRTGTTVWAEGGCLCSLEPSYVRDPNWQLGITVLYVDRKNSRFHIDQIPIVGNRMVYAGETYQLQDAYGMGEQAERDRAEEAA
jgi:hypothetical protein